MVEMALTITLLVMLLVGTVTAAVAYGRNNSLQNAAREASRFGATLHDGGFQAWFDDVRGVARSAATGDLDPGVPAQEICVAFIDHADNASRVVEQEGVAGSVESGECFNDGRSNEARVQVAVQRETKIHVAIFSVDVTLSAPAAARYERSTS